MARAGFLSRFLKPCAVAAFLAVVAACGGGGDGGEPTRTVTTVTVTSPTSTPKQGDTVQLTAIAKDQFGDVIPGTTGTWSSSAPAVATVSATGLLQALAGGTVTVTATISNVPGTLALTVTARVTTTVTVSSPTQTLQAGESAQLTAQVRDQFGDVLAGKTATWSTADSAIATVSSTGLVQALAPGAVSVTATVDGVAGSTSLTVVPPTVASVTVSSPTSTPKEGDSVQLTATARDQFGNIIPGATATWSTSDTNIATVLPSGLVQTLATGTVAVSAMVNGITGTQSLTITAIRVSVTLGAKEVVFRHATDRCEERDTPDQNPRMVRAEDGSLVLFAGNAPRVYVSRGADFGSLKRDCSQPVLVSTNLGTPESYENQEWLWSVYREGSQWHALIHNEFHDAVAVTCKPGDPTPSNLCWYNSITYSVSTDGGRSFVKPSPPAHVVAPAPRAWVPPAQPVSDWYAEGYFLPSNIVHADDGHYYALMSVTAFPQGPRGWCVIRTPQLDDPGKWRAWDGVDFNLRMTSPFITGSPAPICHFLQEPMESGHLVYSSYIGRYLHVAQSQQWNGSRSVCGIYFSLSSDLVHWSKQQFLAETYAFDDCSLPADDPSVLERNRQMNASIIDHSDTTTNFERAGRTPYLYYVRFNRTDMSDPMYWSDRDVVRVPLTLTVEE